METIWHPFTQMKTADTPIQIIRGNGAYLTSIDGIDYLEPEFRVYHSGN